jgi:hypothetical protein
MGACIFSRLVRLYLAGWSALYAILCGSAARASGNATPKRGHSGDVRYWGYFGSVILTLSFSEFDPHRTLTAGFAVAVPEESVAHYHEERRRHCASISTS